MRQGVLQPSGREGGLLGGLGHHCPQSVAAAAGDLSLLARQMSARQDPTSFCAPVSCHCLLNLSESLSPPPTDQALERGSDAAPRGRRPLPPLVAGGAGGAAGGGQHHQLQRVG